jgi:Mrp family chromosome partitioning ATPase
LLSVADARTLSTLSDAVVLVVRAYETPYDAVRRARSLLYDAGARILGVALNDVNVRKGGYGYGYYYRYGYGYGYGAKSGAESAPADEDSTPETQL